jgi:hypothetical protein
MLTMPNDLKKSNNLVAPATRRRSVAIALLLVAMVVMFYAATIVRFGGAIANYAN